MKDTVKFVSPQCTNFPPRSRLYSCSSIIVSSIGGYGYTLHATLDIRAFLPLSTVQSMDHG